MDGFAPRRLTHVNLWVSDLESSVSFFERVCGIELIRREPTILAAFHSNGNTHHDLGVMEISKGRDRVGRDGAIQIPKTRGVNPGLNHFGWEMEDEAQLVDVYKRLKRQNRVMPRLSDHIISRSVYVNDPDGQMNEFYADIIPKWRDVFNLDHEDLVTSVWDPEATPPTSEKFYPVDPKITYVAGAPLKTMKLTGASVGTQRYDEMVEFYTLIGGFGVMQTSNDERRQAKLLGRLGNPDLVLFEVGANEKPGLHTFSFMLDPETDFDRAVAAVQKELGDRPELVDSEDRRALVLDAPDKLFKVEFYISRNRNSLPSLTIQ
ncbi:dioxygenase [Mesorhizobium sp. M7A.F.Ca.US.001.04.1.1]|uniref:VOC family protein n=1 Tax=unclassified Mesorhizobium TaxID=325217 RepID=UPI000FCAA4CD|nr:MULTISPECIES: VOC family protein [unclassified Mesorhizobium]RUY27342.1 dioxygenase [Mesorhizobium sp. M7A.F.Ca.US.001.04.2.1]RUY39388.1 dioxygenase [Mesorhizobium sp. M7A.F.Ca.US.001.04.1.1]